MEEYWQVSKYKIELKECKILKFVNKFEVKLL